MILLRHGQTIFNVVYGSQRIDPGAHDPALTPDGRAQAAAAAERLRAVEITRIITSPCARALETADMVAQATGVPVEVESLVRERSAFACDIGTVRSQLTGRWRDLTFDCLDEIWWHPPPEPEATLAERCRRLRAAMARRDDWTAAAVVTHWGVIRALTGQRLQNGEMVRVDPTAPPPLSLT